MIHASRLQPGAPKLLPYVSQVGVLVDDRQLAALQRSIDADVGDGPYDASAHGGAGPSSSHGKMGGKMGGGGDSLGHSLPGIG